MAAGTRCSISPIHPDNDNALCPRTESEGQCILVGAIQSFAFGRNSGVVSMQCRRLSRVSFFVVPTDVLDAYARKLTSSSVLVIYPNVYNNAAARETIARYLSVTRTRAAVDTGTQSYVAGPKIYHPGATVILAAWPERAEVWGRHIHLLRLLILSLRPAS